MRIRLCVLLAVTIVSACSPDATAPADAAGSIAAADKRDTPPPPLDPDNIVSIAIGSKDHSTLVAALQAADYVRSVANPGPLTVFAPTNAAFAKLPPGTVESLVKPERQSDLREILKYHVAPAVYEASALKDGMVLGMANGKKVTFHRRDGRLMINDATVVTSIRASNGIVHVIDGVLLPPSK